MPRIPAINYDSTHGHAAFLYETPKERWTILSKFFADGIAHNELCVLVTPEQPEEVLAHLKQYGAKLDDAYAKRAFRIFEMDPTYLPAGKFIADYMLRNVQSFQQEATELGYTGLRTAGAMEWLYDHPEATEEAATYEAAVNEPPTANENFVGLCLYPVKEHFTSVISEVGRTHPSLIYDGSVHTSTSFAG